MPGIFHLLSFSTLIILHPALCPGRLIELTVSTSSLVLSFQCAWPMENRTGDEREKGSKAGVTCAGCGSLSPALSAQLCVSPSSSYLSRT